MNPAATPATTPLSLTIAKKVEILRVVARSESGEAGYAAVNPDREFNDPDHPAYQSYHIGLSWGFVQFTQRGGALGRVLAKAHSREQTLREAGNLPEEQSLAALFGADWEAMLRTVDPEQTPRPEARTAPVGGARLWEEPWLARFVAAGAVPYVQAAQNEIAVTRYFDRMLPLARGLGLTTCRGMALLVDRAIHMGVGGARTFIMERVGPIRSDADRSAALAALGHGDDLSAFQRAHGLDTDGRWGPQSHAAMVGALRALGAASPVAIPSPAEIRASLATAGRDAGFARRIDALMTSDLDDTTAYDLG